MFHLVYYLYTCWLLLSSAFIMYAFKLLHHRKQSINIGIFCPYVEKRMPFINIWHFKNKTCNVMWNIFIFILKFPMAIHAMFIFFFSLEKKPLVVFKLYDDDSYIFFLIAFPKILGLLINFYLINTFFFLPRYSK